MDNVKKMSYKLFSFIFLSVIFIVILMIGGNNGAEVSVYETDRAGKILLNETASNNCTVTGENEKYVSFNAQNSLVILTPLDLEILLHEILRVQYECGPERKNLTINIIPVNEFAPGFQQGPYTRDITEGSPVGTLVIYLGNKWKDLDAIKYNKASSFRLYPYAISAFDGRQYVSIDNTTGNITTATVLDYEALRPRSSFMLNISVEDDGGSASLMSFSTVNVTVKDADDNPPVFTKCKYDLTPRCIVPEYAATIDRHFQGTLQKVLPAPVHADDGDVGIRSSILYTLGVNEEISEYISIDNQTGMVDVTMAFTNLSDWTHTQQLTIEIEIIATEVSDLSHSSNVSLKLLVYREFPTIPPPTTVPNNNQTTAPNNNPTDPDSSQSNTVTLILEITIPACVVVIIGLVITIVLCNKRKTKRESSSYRLKKSKTDENMRKLDEYEQKNIDVISSTPINPYELISHYARIDNNIGDSVTEGSVTNESVKEGSVRADWMRQESERCDSVKDESVREESERGESERGESVRGESVREESERGESERGESVREESVREESEKGDSERGEYAGYENDPESWLN